MRRSGPTLARIVVLGALAAGLLASLGCARTAHEDAPPPHGQRRVTVEVGGMVDAACVARIQHHLSLVHGVRHVEVNLEKRRAEVVCENAVADTALTAAVRRAGPDYIGLVLY